MGADFAPGGWWLVGSGWWSSQGQCLGGRWLVGLAKGGRGGEITTRAVEAGAGVGIQRLAREQGCGRAGLWKSLTAELPLSV